MSTNQSLDLKFITVFCLVPQLWVAGAPPEIWDLEMRTESEIEN